ncbi:SOS response-associated peptidase [Hamadaea tsunoensis]|uniref:SOS response-associated peptidase n=1 Tax=Hamadaea tsunoensis TaxID=53368 RepID=UPI00041758D5|nr:SOS response-associated peptidase [Hamadaea tsunoensis]
MCGRYATTRSSADLSSIFEAYDETSGSVRPDYNVAPTDPVPIVRVAEETGARVLTVARWGLIPFWAKDHRVGARMINARAETVMTTRAYARSFERRRCLVPADGWYEWARRPAGKQAYFMTAPDLVFAGIWSTGADRLSFSVLTTASAGPLAEVHDRMPLLLPRDRWAEWLTATASDGLLTPASPEYLSTVEIRAVGPAVGDVRNDGPDLIAPIDDGLLF